MVLKCRLNSAALIAPTATGKGRDAGVMMGTVHPQHKTVPLSSYKYLMASDFLEGCSTLMSWPSNNLLTAERLQRIICEPITLSTRVPVTTEM